MICVGWVLNYYFIDISLSSLHALEKGLLHVSSKPEVFVKKADAKVRQSVNFVCRILGYMV